jgi:hypothetical protein
LDFDSFTGGELSLPELGINIPVAPQSLLGLNGKFLFHGVLALECHSSSISFYSHYSKFSVPNFSSMTPEITKLMNQIDWKIK